MRLESTEIVARLATVLAPDDLETDPNRIGPKLRDNSWLSPVLAEHISEMTESHGASMNVIALASPASIDELRRCVSVLFEADTPMTMLGAGTTNFGQTVPLEGGVVISTRHLNEIIEIGDGFINVQAGVTASRIEAAARETGQALPVITTTHNVATAAGWVCGGHVGLGAELLTVAAEPEVLTLGPSEVHSVLHTYGTTGIVTNVTMRLVPANEWVELVVVHDGFDDAARFVTELSRRPGLRIRVAAAQDPPLTPAFTALRDVVSAGQALTLVVVEASDVDEVSELVASTDGSSTTWRGLGAERKPTLEVMVYGHRMLWVKKLLPESAFLHCYLDQHDPLAHISRIKALWGDRVLVELKFMQSPYLSARFGTDPGEPLPAALVCIADGVSDLDAVMASFDELDVRYQNPHTFFLDQKGLFADPSALRAFKATVDPKGLLNPGKFSDEHPDVEDSSL
jgi:FAD/FMN-containing dehydrogenase